MMLSPMTPEYADYLRDESRREGRADYIAFPTNEDALAANLAEARARGLRVTVQGARTGITAGAVPDGGVIINLSRMARVTGLAVRDRVFYARVQPGVTLAALREAIDRRAFDSEGWDASSRSALAALRAAPPQFFPPDPTETTASLGGMVACNASGALTYRYGSTRHWVESVRAMTPRGVVFEVRRGVDRARGRHFRIEALRGATIEGALPAYRPPSVKNAAGYYAAENMDLVDLLIGSEGTLAVVTEMELRLMPRPAVMWGVMVRFDGESAAIAFVRVVRGDTTPFPWPCAAIEYMDARALDLLREAAPTPEGRPPWSGRGCGVYVEAHGESETELEIWVEALLTAITACGGRAEDAWMATSVPEMRRMKDFRHALPETVNARIGARRRDIPGLAKLGSDMAVPDDGLEKVMTLYREDLARTGWEYVIFGHIGNNHLHVNILPRSMDEYAAGRALYAAWAEQVVAWGGTVSAEHGVGKLKTGLLSKMLGARGVAEMAAVKKVFDPDGMLNVGNVMA